LAQQGVGIAPLQAANCGFDVQGREGLGWTEHFQTRFAGHPLKTVKLQVHQTSTRVGDRDDPVEALRFDRQGEFVITQTGVEGSLIYAASGLLRDDLAKGHAQIALDLLPDKSLQQVQAQVRWPRGSRSWSSHLKSRLGLEGVKLGLLHELCPPEAWAQPEALAAQIKGLVVVLQKTRPVAEAISTAGGVKWTSLSPQGMLLTRPGVYCAGEMIDWEAPTGGYLLTACLASGRAAGQGILTNL
jgi:hypothetical protein